MIKDIIQKKRLGYALEESEIKEAFFGYLEGNVADYQMSALLMAICINGMTDEETFVLTDLFLNSGDVLDFSHIPGIKVDKHSTGGVGDKTTLIVVPIVASLSVPVIKMSGRALGYTGGTVDKLESIPGYQTELSADKIKKQVLEVGAVMMGQTTKLCPLDKKIYALRDVTGTTDSIALIAASIMSKKLAGGADKILIDVKVGKGAFMKTEKEAQLLADLMIKIGKKYGRETRVMISNMDRPLGRAVGNALEVKEALDVLQGKQQDSLRTLCVELATSMVSMGRQIPMDDAKVLVEESIDSLKAYHKLLEIIKYQEGDISGLAISNNVVSITSLKSGVVQDIDAKEVAHLAFSLGAGRITKEEKVDLSTGVYINVEVGQKVEEGDILCYLYTKENMTPSCDITKIFEIS